MRLALLTGATGGLGYSLASLLHKKKIPLLLTGRDPQKLAQMGAEFQARTLLLDLKHRQPLLDLIRSEAPDLVINNAGYALYGDALSHTTQEALDQLEINGAALLEITLEAARTLKAQNLPGTILNISSVAGEYTFPSMAIYAAAKAFVTSLSQSLDYEMRPYNIHILAALPGQIATPFATRAANKQHLPHMHAMNPDTVAAALWRQIQTQKPYEIIDWRYRLSLSLSRLFPKDWISLYLRRSIQKRIYRS
jgi:hypothetical protein